MAALKSLPDYSNIYDISVLVFTDTTLLRGWEGLTPAPPVASMDTTWGRRRQYCWALLKSLTPASSLAQQGGSASWMQGWGGIQMPQVVSTDRKSFSLWVGMEVPASPPPLLMPPDGCPGHLLQAPHCGCACVVGLGPQPFLWPLIGVGGLKVSCLSGLFFCCPSVDRQGLVRVNLPVPLGVPSLRASSAAGLEHIRQKNELKEPWPGVRLAGASSWTSKKVAGDSWSGHLPGFWI